MFRRLRVPFADVETFRREYETHIAYGALFVPTPETFEAHELVEIELELGFCRASWVVLAEVVRRVQPVDQQRMGVAFCLLEGTPQLRGQLEALTGVVMPEPVVPDRPGPPRRHERRDGRLQVVIRAARGEWLSHTLNLSCSGALLASGDEAAPPLGQRVHLSLIHPQCSELLEVDARVVRHELRAGVVEAFAVEFAAPLSGAVEGEFLESSLAAARARSIGSMEGDLRAMSPIHLLQLLPSSASEGTLLIHSPQPGLNACVLFQNGHIAFVSVGALRGEKALARLLAWQEGRFAYSPEIPPADEREPRAPLSLPGALLEALQHLDELAEFDRSALPPAAIVERTPGSDRPDSKLENQILDLLDRPRRVTDLIDLTPAYDVLAYRALASLRDAGACRVRASSAGGNAAR